MMKSCEVYHTDKYVEKVKYKFLSILYFYNVLNIMTFIQE